MTEDEAREKWCPFARVVEITKWDLDTIEGVAAGNRMISSADEANCIASACMAWRWIGYIDANGARHINEVFIAKVLHGIHPENVTPIGCCGLAGKLY